MFYWLLVYCKPIIYTIYTGYLLFCCVLLLTDGTFESSPVSSVSLGSERKGFPPPFSLGDVYRRLEFISRR